MSCRRKVIGKRILPLLVFLLEDDLGQNRASDVLASLGVVNDKVLACLQHAGEVFQRHIGARSSVIEPPVGVLFNNDRRFGLGHEGFRCRPVCRRVCTRAWRSCHFARPAKKKISRFLETGYRFVQLLPLRAERRPSAPDGRRAALAVRVVRAGLRTALTSRRGCPTKAPELATQSLGAPSLAGRKHKRDRLA